MTDAASPAAPPAAPVAKRPLPEGIISALIILALLVVLHLLGWKAPPLPELRLAAPGPSPVGQPIKTPVPRY